MVAPGRSPLAVHPLLDHCPFALVRDEEAVQVKVEAVLERRAVDLGDQPACAGELAAVEPGLVAAPPESLANGGRGRRRL